MKQLFYSITMSMFGVITFFILLITYWLVYPYIPVKFVTPINVLTKNVIAGEMVVYEVEYCKNISIPATLTKEYIDGVVYATPPVIVNNPIGCGKHRGSTLVPNLPSGTYIIRFSYIYTVNPIRDMTITVESNTFTIQEKKQIDSE